MVDWFSTKSVFKFICIDKKLMKSCMHGLDYTSAFRDKFRALTPALLAIDMYLIET